MANLLQAIQEAFFRQKIMPSLCYRVGLLPAVGFFFRECIK
jgi:hypothetical protein